MVELRNVSMPDTMIAHYARISHGYSGEPLEQKDDISLLGKLYAKGHLEPFEFQTVTFYVSCSIVVERQLLRHRIGVSKVERSLRYTEANGEYYRPFITPLHNYDKLGAAMKQSFQVYQNLLESGVQPEIARYVLPLGTRTEMYVTFNTRSLLHFIELRNKPHVQPETRELAQGFIRELGKHEWTQNIYKLVTAHE